MGLICKSIVILFIAITVAFVWRMCSYLDINKVPYIHKPGRCSFVEPIKDGSEDVALLPGGQAVITSGLRYTNSPELAGLTGNLYFFEFDQKIANPKAELIKIKWSQDKVKLFNPHGIKAFINKKGIIHLYVINHELQADDAIEIFEFNPKSKSANHVKTIRHELIFNANNLAIIGEEEFFVTNDAYFRNAFLKSLEFMLPIFKLGSIVHYNKGSAKVADQFLFMPNGLDIDKSKKNLFVGSILTKQLWIYDIDKNMNIVKTKAIDVGAMVDNVFYDDETLTVWLGCHPVAHMIATYMSNPKSIRAPSLVIKVQFSDGQFSNYSLHDPYADDGRELSASTVAVPYKNQILIGSITDKLLLCDLTNHG